MPKFEITHVKTVWHYAKVVVEAKDKESAEYGDMGTNIDLSDWFDLDWYDEDEEPDWEALEVKEIEHEKEANG